MRVIAGRYRGHRLASVRGEIRPTSDRLRETLFNILRDSVAGSVWLDGFAGSGAVGIEALSRGARYVIFNDKSRQAIRLLRKNLQICRVEEGYEIHQKDLLTLLRLELKPLDIIFLDAPYAYPRYDKLLSKLGESLLKKSSLIILEVFKKTQLESVLPSSLEVWRTVQEGDSRLIFLRPSPRK
ncbi:MAG: 16S rRNA (guanine(966)-N(2))-methyltransferase RsmD [Acidobacteriota bacterium]